MGGLLLCLTVAAADAESGVSAWMELRSELIDAQGRIGQLQADNASLHEQVVRLREDPFAIERAIREDLELARRGETVVRFSQPADLAPADLAPAEFKPTTSRR